MRSVWLRPFSSVGRGVTVRGIVLVRGRGRLIAGDDVVFDAGYAAIELHSVEGATIEIGDGAYLGPGVSIEATQRVAIGARAQLGALVKIMDNNWHHVTENRDSVNLPRAGLPVYVGPDAVVEHRSTLLPGAGLGAGVHVLADSVVSRQVPDNAVVRGAPARIVRQSP
jgi:maltose O-acetyltransferase